MTVFKQPLLVAHWSAFLVRFGLIILINRGGQSGGGGVRGIIRTGTVRLGSARLGLAWRSLSAPTGPPLAERRMLENKRERLKTFLRKIDEKAIVRIKHFMKESYPVESSGGGVPAKLKKSRSTSSKDSVKKAEARKTLSLEAAQLEIQEQHKTLTRQLAIRSQTFDVDSSSFQRTQGSGAQSSFIKHNATFHKLFPDIPESEDLIHAYVCALQKEVPYHGRLYITSSHACFHSSVLLKDTKVVIPVSSICVVKKQNTALLVPNALSVRTTEGEKSLFVSLRNREACYQLLCSVCPQLEDRSTNSSPVISSAEHSFDKSKLVSTRPQKCAAELTHDCVCVPSWQNSSQSSLDGSFEQFVGSEPQALQDKPLHNPNKETSLPNGKGSTFKSLHEQQSETSSSGDDLSVSGLPRAPPVPGSSWIWNVTEKAKSLLVQREASTLNTLLVIYLILVVMLLVSSSYIGLRIVALEEQLMSLGALPEFTLHSRYRQDT
ncbi:GRAM domain-containing protein 2B isoform X2 [Syngnathoides biaculeatus]|uniref:GRAM domain-containing protein 2B isoform X2 n=1 Tax=Syngnathoides biaculeatus TaxID=300417 RepID=UPI002ADDD514|nr:GRAM domain-containing protein 2B isoform X2 [Syngnathoides biaculeatus]